MTMTKQEPINMYLMKASRKLRYFFIVAMSFITECFVTVTCFAGPANNGATGGGLTADEIKLQDNPDAGSILGKTVGLFVGLIRYAGVILAIFGIVKLVIAWNNDQADQIKSSAVMIISGIVMFSLKTVLSLIGLTQ